MSSYFTQRCEIKRINHITDSDGRPSEQFVDVLGKRLKCRYDPRRVSSFDFTNEEARPEVQMVTFFTEYPVPTDYISSDISEITNDMYIRFDNKVYRIKYVNPMSPYAGGLARGNHLEIVCYRAVNQ